MSSCVQAGYDPKGLLNPGKMLSFEPEGATLRAADEDLILQPEVRLLNSKQVETLPKLETLLGCDAAIEQHGHHLPLRPIR